ncbi:SRPBCC family protein [Amycolatopsis japonica]|uniref:SRPBCC family protein n=1 Tax=Amycolatopsis japonica TaxID=208439 RepID=UPI0033F83EDB
MSVDVRTEIVIDAPRDEVAAYAADPSKAPSWYANIKSVEWETPPPLAVGSKIAFVAEFLGRRLAYTYEVTDHVPGERLTMRTAQGPFPMETTYTWTTEGSGTRMTLRNQGTPAGFTKLAAPLLTTKMRHANTTDLHTLKALLERP